MSTTALLKRKKYLLISLLGVVAVLGAGFFASRAGLDKALVKQQLDASIEAIKEKGRARGRDIDIRYGDIEMAGGLFNRHVVVHTPIFTIKPMNREPLQPGAKAKPDSLVITTATMIVYPKAADLSAATFSLAEPLNFAAEEEPEKSLLKIQASSPLELTVTQKSVNKVPYVYTSHISPAQLILTYLREEATQGTEDQTPNIIPVYHDLIVDIAQGSRVENRMAQDKSGLGVIDVSYGKITLTPKIDPQGMLSIASIKAISKNEINEKNLNVMSIEANVGPVEGNAELFPYAPVTFGLEFGFEGLPAGAAVAAATPGVPTPESTIKLKKFALNTKQANLSASADFTATPADMLPTGTANITLSNVPHVLSELRKYHLLDAENETRYLPMLELITGVPTASLQELNIPIERTRGGSFKIGKTTFEELFAFILKQALQGNGGAQPQIIPVPKADGTAPQSRNLVPQLPSSDKPRLSPITVRDYGVRG